MHLIQLLPGVHMRGHKNQCVRPRIVCCLLYNTHLNRQTHEGTKRNWWGSLGWGQVSKLERWSYNTEYTKWNWTTHFWWLSCDLHLKRRKQTHLGSHTRGLWRPRTPGCSHNSRGHTPDHTHTGVCARKWCLLLKYIKEIFVLKRCW